MIKYSFLLICFLALTGCQKDSQTQFSMDQDQVMLVITQNTTKAELAQIALELKEKRNIDLDYSKSTFKANGRISEVNLEVDCNDGFKGTTKCSATALKFQNIGFLRDYGANSDRVFHIGSM